MIPIVTPPAEVAGSSPANDSVSAPAEMSGLEVLSNVASRLSPVPTIQPEESSYSHLESSICGHPTFWLKKIHDAFSPHLHGTSTKVTFLQIIRRNILLTDLDRIQEELAQALSSENLATDSGKPFKTIFEELLHPLRLLDMLSDEGKIFQKECEENQNLEGTTLESFIGELLTQDGVSAQEKAFHLIACTISEGGLQEIERSAVSLFRVQKIERKAWIIAFIQNGFSEFCDFLRQSIPEGSLEKCSPSDGQSMREKLIQFFDVAESYEFISQKGSDLFCQLKGNNTLIHLKETINQLEPSPNLELQFFKLLQVAVSDEIAQELNFNPSIQPHAT